MARSNRPRDPCRPTERKSERSRLRQHLWIAAYELLVPGLRQRTGKPKTTQSSNRLQLAQ